MEDVTFDASKIPIIVKNDYEIIQEFFKIDKESENNFDKKKNSKYKYKVNIHLTSCGGKWRREVEVPTTATLQH